MITAGQPGPARRPLAVLGAILLLVVGALVLVIAAAHVTPTGYAPVRAQDVHVAPGVPLPLPTLPSLPPRHHDHPSNSQGALALLAIIGLCLAIAAAVLSVIIHSVHMPRLRRRERAAYQLAPESMLGVAEQMTAAVESGMGELDAERPVRDSIIACWQRLRVSAADAGIAPVPSDTPEQAINRVLAASGARAEPLAALAELYREARFSRHAMDGAAVTAARDALGAILADLRQGADA